MTIPVVRKRAKKPKTRTGCRTCRQRHIKCDEEKPICNRCWSSGKKCLGYDFLAVKAKDTDGSTHQAVLRPKGSTPDLVPKIDSPLMLYSGLAMMTTSCPMNPQETYAFDFFRLQTVTQLPGSSWTLSWERLALQTGYHEAAVTHAAIALGAIHRALTFESHRGINGVNLQQREFALAQYNLAMVHVRRHIERLERDCSEADVEVVLLVSLLFFCFEVLQSEDARATMHLRTGLRILYERVRSQSLIGTESELESKRVIAMSAIPRNNMDLIVQTFVRLDGDLTIVGGDEPYLFPVCCDDIPGSFHSLEQALVHLDAIAVKVHDVCRDIVILGDKEVVSNREDFDLLDDDMRNCLACVASRTVNLDSVPELEERMQNVKDELSAWTSALAHVPMSSQRRSARLLMQIHFYYAWLVVSTWRDEDEMIVDRFKVQFEHALSVAEEFVEMHLDITASPHTRAIMNTPGALTRQAFSLGTDLIPCVALIAFKSRATAVRRRCVEVLKTINLQGVFDSYFLVSFVQLIWDLEENFARQITEKPVGVDFKCHEVPAEARLLEIELSPMDFSHDFYKADVGRLVYARSDEHGRIQAREELFNIRRPGVQSPACKN